MESADPAWNPQTDSIRHRITRLTPYSLDSVLSINAFPDGKAVLVLAVNGPGQLAGYRIGITEPSFTQLFVKPLNYVSVAMDNNGSALYGIGPAGLEKISLQDGRTTPIPFTAQMDYDPQGEMAWLFQHLWQMTKLKFYRPDMHGRDWEAIRSDYAKYLPSIQAWEDFCDMMGEIAGELNASHMGCLWLHQPDLADATAALGIYADPSHAGPGVKIKQVLAGSPCDRAVQPIAAGSLITMIDGVEVLHEENLHQMLNHKSGTPVELTILAPAGKGTHRIVVTPISLAEEKELAMDQWMLRRREQTTQRSNGRLGYLYISAMDGENYQRAVDYVFGEGRDMEAIVIDVRYNRGGNLHDQLVALFTGGSDGGFLCPGWFPRQSDSLQPLGQTQHSARQCRQLFRRQYLSPLVPANEDGQRRRRTRSRHRHRRLVDGIAQQRYQIRNPPTQCQRQDHRMVRKQRDRAGHSGLQHTPEDIAAGRDSQLNAAIDDLLKRLPPPSDKNSERSDKQ